MGEPFSIPRHNDINPASKLSCTSSGDVATANLPGDPAASASTRSISVSATALDVPSSSVAGGVKIDMNAASNPPLRALM